MLKMLARPQGFSPDMMKGGGESMASFMPKPLPNPPYEEKIIPGAPGAPDVRIYVINAKAGQSRPAILHIHGGGFISGTASMSIPNMQSLSEKLDCVAVTVDYRLAPGTKFPGSLEDNYAALKWLYDHATELGVDRPRIAVMGESAGGGHAAMLAIAARNRHEVPLVFQALIFPMLDDRTGTTIQVPSWAGHILWTAESNRQGWASLLGVLAGSKEVPDGSVPAREADLSGLPSTFIAVGTLDLFANEDIEYARRLMNAGVPSELHLYPGAFHAFTMFGQASLSKACDEAMIQAFRRAFRQPVK